MQLIVKLLVHLLILRMARNRLGRWVLVAVFLLLGAASALAAATGPAQDRVTFAVSAAFCLTLVLVVLLQPVLQRRRLRRLGRQMGAQRIAELKASGQLLPIPAAPPPLKSMSSADLQTIDSYVKQLAAIPWGDRPTFPEWEVRHVFDRTVARVRRVTGDWSQLHEPIAAFAAMPRPLCFVGAAEVMLRLSYLQGWRWAPEGLRQGMRFIARVQYHEPLQPDALVIRTKLLAGYPSTYWLDLADQTLALLKGVAPNHPRIPDAEQIIHWQRGEYEQAFSCARQTLEYPPSPEEEYVALAAIPRILQQLKRYDEALAAFDDALERDPRSPWEWHNKSLLLLDLNREREALDCNSRALSLMQFGAARQTRERILARLAATRQA